MIFKWDKNYETGHTLIDQQHQTLVMLINRLDESLHLHLESTPSKKSLMELLDYTHYHFKTEEDLMRSSHLESSCVEAHCEKHLKFTQRIGEVLDSSVDFHAIENLLGFLVDWLSNHILVTDMAMVQELGLNHSPVETKPGQRDDNNESSEGVLRDALKESESRFRLLADSAPVIMWLSNGQGEVSFFNTVWWSCTGQMMSEAEGMGWLNSVHPEDRSDYLQTYQQAHQKKEPFSRELRIRLSQGQYRWMLEKANPRFLDNGQFLGMTGICMDINDQKEAQELQLRLNTELENRVNKNTHELVAANQQLKEYHLQLETEKAEQQTLIDKLKLTHQQLIQSEKMSAIGQLAAGVAHEINNPVGYVKSNLSTLSNYVRDLFDLLSAYEVVDDLLDKDERFQKVVELKKAVDPAFLKEDTCDLLDETLEGLNRIKKIVQDLKDFSRTDEEEWQYADLHQCLDTTLSVAWNELKYKAQVVKQYGALSDVQCLPHQLNQVFMNLLVNAAQAIEDQGTINITTEQRDDWVDVCISDTGAGISQEHIDRIFEPFFTTKPVGKGTGLGLSISYGIIQKHKGELRVRSEPGVGTSFTVSLPILQPAAPEDATVKEA